MAQNMAQNHRTSILGSWNSHWLVWNWKLWLLKKKKGLLWNHFWSDYWIWLVSTCSGSCASYSSYLVWAGVSERWNLYRGLPGTRKAKRGSQKSWFISRGNCFPSGRNLTLPLFLLGSCCIISNFEESLSWYSNRTCSTPVFQIHIKKKKKKKKIIWNPNFQNHPKSIYPPCFCFHKQILFYQGAVHRWWMSFAPVASHTTWSLRRCGVVARAIAVGAYLAIHGSDREVGHCCWSSPSFVKFRSKWSQP